MKRQILTISKDKAEIEMPSLSRMFRIPIEIFNKFAKKKVKITIELMK